MTPIRDIAGTISFNRPMRLPINASPPPNVQIPVTLTDFAMQHAMLTNVAVGSKADLAACFVDVRYIRRTAWDVRFVPIATIPLQQG